MRQTRMTLFGLARSNFRRSVREFGMMILSLAFSVFIFFNFQNVIYADSMKVLEEFNKRYIDIVIEALSVVFAVFLFFFVWYASNVFLNQRKKEIGIYIFMGLDHARIGKMYVIESCMVGLTALAAGLCLGVAFSKLFQMALLKLSEISVDVRFSFSPRAIAITAAVFLAIYGLMTAKGYHTLKTSSVLALLSGAKQKELKPERAFVTALRIVVGLGILAAGFGVSWRTGGMESLEYALAAVILVIVGVYLLYSGLIPALLRAFTRNKAFLYRKERNLWVNSLAFRMKKNYRTYAMVTVLMICSVTVMAFSIAMKQRYDRIVHFDQTYTYQIVSSHTWDGDEIATGIGQENEVLFWNELPVTILDSALFDTEYVDMPHGVTAFSQVEQAARRAGLPFAYEPLQDSQVIELSHEILMSLIEEQEGRRQQIGEDVYEVICDDTTPYLGKLQTYMSLYIVSDAVYERLSAQGVENWIYNYCIADVSNADASRPYLTDLAQTDTNEEEGLYTGVNFTEYDGGEDSWIRVMYSLGWFLFATFLLASGSIIFMKTGNDAYEERERYQVLGKLGIPRRVLARSLRSEICFTYYCPFVLMAVASFFSIRALGSVMHEDLFRVNLWSAGAVLGVFTVICMLSVRMARKKLLRR